MPNPLLIYIDQELYAERVFYDPNSTTKTKTDGQYMGRYDQMDRKLFEETYPDVPWPKSFPSNFNLEFFTWGDKDVITICEYYEKEWYNFTLYKLSDGRTVTKKEYNKLKKEYEDGLLQAASMEGDEVQEKNNYQEAMDAQLSQEMPQQMPPQGGMQPQQQPMMPPQMAQGMPSMAQLPMMPGLQPLPEILEKRRSRDYKIVRDDYF